MSELKMTLNQMKTETQKAFIDGYDHPEDMSGCTNAADQEFVCCGNDCSTCSGNNECRPSNKNCNCTNSDENNFMSTCPNENLESCIIEKRWEMSEHTSPQNIADENGNTVHYIKVIKIIRNYRQNENPLS